MKRLLKLFLPMFLICTLLSGCMSEVFYVAIEPDGSGQYSSDIGVSEEYLKSYAEAHGEDFQNLIADLSSFKYQGVTYYGRTGGGGFTSLSGFNEMFRGKGRGDSYIKIQRDGNGFAMVIQIADKNAVKSQILTAITESEFKLDETINVDEMLGHAVINFNFQFPTKVYQTDGPTDGVTVENRSVNLDMAKLLSNGKATYAFTTATDKHDNPMRPFIFTDTDDSQWYYPAVRALHNGRLFNGYGNGKFGPHNKLTYAQFCQVLSNITGIEGIGSADHWATPAVMGCIKSGYVDAVPVSEWDNPISREVATDALIRVLLTNTYEKVHDYSPDDIPDYGDITEKYQENVLKAYNYGLISGVDCNRTFAPQSTLTRAQLCQMLYNMGWTRPM